MDKRHQNTCLTHFKHKTNESKSTIFENIIRAIFFDYFVWNANHFDLIFISTAAAAATALSTTTVVVCVMLQAVFGCSILCVNVSDERRTKHAKTITVCV